MSKVQHAARSFSCWQPPCRHISADRRNKLTSQACKAQSGPQPSVDCPPLSVLSLLHTLCCTHDCRSIAAVTAAVRAHTTHWLLHWPRQRYTANPQSCTHPALFVPPPLRCGVCMHPLLLLCRMSTPPPARCTNLPPLQNARPPCPCCALLGWRAISRPLLGQLLEVLLIQFGTPPPTHTHKCRQRCCAQTAAAAGSGIKWETGTPAGCAHKVRRCRVVSASHVLCMMVATPS